MGGAAALSLTSDVPLATGNGGPRGLCQSLTGSPMADTCVRQVVPGRWRGEAAARVCPQQTLLPPEEVSCQFSGSQASASECSRGRAGGLGDGGGGIAAPLRTLDAIAGLPASALLGSGRARWRGRRCWGRAGVVCLLPRVITGSLTAEGRSMTPFRFASERRDGKHPHSRALPPP